VVSAAAISTVTEGLGAQLARGADTVLDAIRQASNKVGVDFSYMVAKATQESGLDPSAQAKSSSATGLYQFVEQTWLRMVKAYGAKYGLASAAEKIAMGSDGVARVKDSQTRQDILSLRMDPSLSAEMAAELTNENRATLKKEVGGKIGSTELYLAHFLGSGGATDLLKAMKSNPDASAADLLPSAAAANENVFYDKAGSPRSVADVYNLFSKKFDGAKSGGVAGRVAVASSRPAASSTLTSGVTLASAGGYASPISASGLSLLSRTGAESLGTPLAAMMMAQTGVPDVGDYASLGLYSQEQRRKEQAALFGISA
jgi:hypothetical protein